MWVDDVGYKLVIYVSVCMNSYILGIKCKWRIKIWYKIVLLMFWLLGINCY